MSKTVALEDSMRSYEYVRTLGIVLKNVALGANFASLSLIARPASFVGYSSESLFLYKTLTGKRRLKQRPVFDVIPCANIEEIKLTKLSDSGMYFGPLPALTQDLISLCLMCRALKPRVIFEIGTLKGYTALHLALNAPSATVYTLDLPGSGDPSLATTMMDSQHVESHRQIKKLCFEDVEEVRGRVHCLYGDSALFDFSPFYEKVDLFFVDGAHSYEYVRSDTISALRCCRKGSYIAWHDFGRVGVNGVSRYLFELAQTREIYSIPGGSLAFMRC
jgi:hypothetical protein